VDEIRQSPELLDIAQGDRIVLLGRQDAGHYETDTKFVNCVADRLQNISGLDVLSEASFVNELFPWFEPRTAPKSLKRMRRLMDEPLVANKIDTIKLRYLVWMDGYTENVEQSGSMSCAAGVGGAGCFGLLSWNKLSFYEAVVWDLLEMKEEGRVRVDSEGTNYVIGALVPIPLLTKSKGDACKGMGNQLRSFFEVEA
jgi:hypothetical protein